ncbi:unnamed protein product [Brassica rapa]|uniref:Uncharacterized protein n=1 Tax=Brassica campestris TaxID=3711 RepID=A0A8D9HX11_BRACM|nr:unnamed protein product [Brassica rapa]
MWNFKSMTDDDPMKFGFGSPAIKDKKKKKKKAFKLDDELSVLEVGGLLLRCQNWMF